MSGVTITRRREEVLDDLRGLYLAMRTHHAEIAPDFGPLRTADESWSRRRRAYHRWLDDDPEAFVLVARDAAGAAVGYAFVRTENGMPAWRDPARFGKVETLSVADDRRGEGVGAALLDRVYGELRPLGIDRVALDVVATNAAALRFYEREGFAPRFTQLWGHRPVT